MAAWWYNALKSLSEFIDSVTNVFGKGKKLLGGGNGEEGKQTVVVVVPIHVYVPVEVHVPAPANEGGGGGTFWAKASMVLASAGVAFGITQINWKNVGAELRKNWKLMCASIITGCLSILVGSQVVRRGKPSLRSTSTSAATKPPSPSTSTSDLA